MSNEIEERDRWELDSGEGFEAIDEARGRRLLHYAYGDPSLPINDMRRPTGPTVQLKIQLENGMPGHIRFAPTG